MAGLVPAIHVFLLGVGLVARAVDQWRLADDPLHPVDLQREAEPVGEARPAGLADQGVEGVVARIAVKRDKRRVAFSTTAQSLAI